MFISIIIPAYNAENTISRALDSLLQQTHDDFEVIVINDGSKDRTVKILEAYEDIFRESGKRIKIINQENLGVSVARNRGISEASGDYITFLDSDDYLKFNMVKTLYDYIKKLKSEYLIYGFYELNGDEEKEFDSYGAEAIDGKENLKDNIHKLIPTRILNSPCNKLYKTSILRSYSIKFDEKLSLGEDLNFNLNYYFKINNLQIIRERLYVIDQSNSYLSTKYRENYYDDRIASLRAMKNVYSKNGIDESIFNWLYVKLVYACIFNMFRHENKLSSTKKISFLKDILSVEEINEAIQNFKSENIYQKILLEILKTKNYNFIIFISYIFNKCKKIVPMSLRKLSV